MIDISDGLSTDLATSARRAKPARWFMPNSLPMAFAGERRLNSPFMAEKNTNCSSRRAPNRPVPKEIAGVPVTLIGEILARQANEAGEGRWKITRDSEAGRLAAFRMSLARMLSNTIWTSAASQSCE